MITIFDNDNRTYYITFINADGYEFTIQPANYLLLNFEGFENPDTDIQLSKAPYQDGKTYIDDNFQERYLVIEFAFFGSSQQDLFDRRVNINNRFNPRLGIGTLKFNQLAGETYCLDVLVRRVRFSKNIIKNYDIAIVEMVAPNPFWYLENSITRYLVGFSGGLSFPFSFPLSFGTVGTRIDVVNSGNINTPVLINFNGEIVDPIITNNTTGKSIIISKTIADGDTLVINTAFGNKSVQILSGGVYSNAFEYVDPDSEFWELIPGINDISYSASSEGANAKGTLLYYDRFTGV